MNAFAESLFPVRIVIAHRGRSVVAARDLAPGTPFFASTPAAFFPSFSGARCSTCFAGEAADGDGALLRCTACRAVVYCSRACQRGDWGAHRAECAHQLRLFAEEPSGALTLLLLGRLARGCSLRAPDAPPAAEGCARVYRHTLADVNGMQSATPGDAPSRAQAATASRLEALITRGIERGFLSPTPGGAPATSSAGGGVGWYLRTALALGLNDFLITDELQSGRAAGVYPLGALLNHACAPNSVVCYVTMAEALALLRSEDDATPQPSSSASPPSPTVQLFRTTRAVACGEELVHSYVDLALPRFSRAAHLRSAYGFECECASCSAAPESPLATDAVLLGSLQEGGLPPSAADGDSSGALALAPLPPLIMLGVPMLVGAGEEGVDNSARVAGEEGGGEGFFNDLRALPMSVRVSLLEAQDLIALGRAGGGGGATADCTPTLSSSLTARLLDKEALTRVKYAAAGWGDGSPPISLEEALGVAREIALLERGAAQLRLHLQPLHLAVHAAVSDALHKHLLVGELPAAAAACEHLVAFYRAAYAPLCPAHPMLSLQLFTLGDIFSQLAEHAERDAGEGGAGGRRSAAPARWLCTPARAAALKAVYVEWLEPYRESAEVAAPHLRISPVSRAIVCAPVLPIDVDTPTTTSSSPSVAAPSLTALALTRARAWREYARAVYGETHALLLISHGRGHSLTRQAAALLADAVARGV